MPRFDKSGPEGKGSQTGKGLGKCNPKPQETDQQIPSEDQQRPTPQNRGCGKGQKMRRRRGSS
jgi:hypothetical protein